MTHHTYAGHTLAEIKEAAEKATPQDIDKAEIIEADQDGTRVIECPACSGEGCVTLEADYCNYDSAAIGVQFYGIGNEHGAAERYFRAANPATVLAMAARIEELEKDAARLDLLEARQNLEVGYETDDGDLIRTVHSVAGGRNDREWKEIGRGFTLRAAIDAAIDAAMEADQ